jgi:peroxiredoxin
MTADNLQSRIDAEVRGLTPPEIDAMIDQVVDDLRARGETPGLQVGDRAPDFEAPDAHGSAVRLGDLLARGPVVLSFYRGAWCPICSLELRALREILPELRRAGASLVAVSPQAPDVSLGFVESLDLGFDVLSDVDQSVLAAYRLRFELAGPLRDLYEQFGMALSDANADGSWGIPVPATFILDRDGIVRARHVDPDYRTRMEPADILAAVGQLA